MNKVHLSILGVVIILAIIGLIALLTTDNGAHLEREIARASADFKADQNFRAEPAKKLIPYLEIGMTMEEVETLLGKPNRKQESDGCLFWFYILGYSHFLDVQFDPNGKVQEIEACAPGLGGESIDANKPSGYYKLEK